VYILFTLPYHLKFQNDMTPYILLNTVKFKDTNFLQINLYKKFIFLITYASSGISFSLSCFFNSIKNACHF
jgi:hypothetical protein